MNTLEIYDKCQSIWYELRGTTLCICLTNDFEYVVSEVENSRILTLGTEVKSSSNLLDAIVSFICYFQKNLTIKVKELEERSRKHTSEIEKINNQIKECKEILVL